jgi:hypothetical protein
MELDDLKSAWSKFSTENTKRTLSENDIRKMLESRTTDISQKISRNIRIGFGIVLLWACIGVGSDFIFSPMIADMAMMPDLSERMRIFILVIDILNYMLIFGAISIFWYRYNHMVKRNIDRANLKETLNRIINIVDSYRKMFYVILFVVMIDIIVSFTTGYYMGYNHQVQEMGLDVNAIPALKWLIIVLSFLITIGVLVGGFYFLFSLFYRRLYGRYLSRLKDTLRELNEIPA